MPKLSLGLSRSQHSRGIWFRRGAGYEKGPGGFTRRFPARAAKESAAKIAGSLSLSVKTVSTYRARVLEKLGLKSSAEIIQYAVQHQLILPE